MEENKEKELAELRKKLKELLVDSLSLEDIKPEDIKDDEILFGEGLSLDSLDAVETNFWRGTGYKITKGFPKDVWKLPEPSEDESKQALSVLEDMNYFDFSKKSLIKQFHNFIGPIMHNVDREPYVIVRIREIGDIERAGATEDTKATKLFCFEIFDNGVGMIKEDLAKFGLYLASSKSKTM